MDWLRGVAGIIMLQGHVFQSFLKPDLRGGAPYMLSQFLGGMPPAIFLFLTGVTLALLMHSMERKGLPRIQRITGTLRRAGYLLALAFLFRLQLWIFSLPGAPWTSMLKVDILNCMGFTIALSSVLTLFTTEQRIRIGAGLGVLIAAASPLISQFHWSGVPWLMKAYLAPDYDYFSIFPWAAYLAFGISAGSLLRLLKREQLERTMQWGALLGMGLIVTARYFANLPFSIYPKSEFWLDSPAQVFIKLGVTLLILAVAYVWTQFGAVPGWSWVRQFGTTSLLVYWVHIELVYGRWLPFCKNSLDVGQTVISAIVVIGLMLLLAVVKTRHRDIAASFSSFRPAWTSPKPDRIAAD
ncbi:MAG: heparan-alpha-glucosaminide N-acetyltransferase domain-containing protein [Bryobacteraceae bacterium]